MLASRRPDTHLAGAGAAMRSAQQEAARTEIAAEGLIDFVPRPKSAQLEKRAKRRAAAETRIGNGNKWAQVGRNCAHNSKRCSIERAAGAARTKRPPRGSAATIAAAQLPTQLPTPRRLIRAPAARAYTAQGPAADLAGELFRAPGPAGGGGGGGIRIPPAAAPLGACCFHSLADFVRRHAPPPRQQQPTGLLLRGAARRAPKQTTAPQD